VSDVSANAAREITSSRHFYYWFSFYSNTAAPAGKWRFVCDDCSQISSRSWRTST